MEEADQLCPECGFAQTKDAPFCENCGFRVRRAETVREGHRAIKKDLLLAAGFVAGEAPSGGPVAGASPTMPEPVPVVADTGAASTPVETRPAIFDSATQLEQPAVTLDTGTAIEGLPAISLTAQDAVGETQRQPAIVDLPPVRSPHAQPQPTADAVVAVAPTSTTTSAQPTIVIAGVAVVASLLAIGAFVALDREQAPAPSAPPAVRTVLELAPGPYKRGLDKRVRSFILLTCSRVKSDAAECEQDTLLRGEFPQVDVEVPAYRIDSHEVTNADYQACVAAGSCAEPDYRECRVYTHQGLQVSLRPPKALQEPARPVICVDRSSAESYCAFAGGRLPSEDEWEKAARGTKGRLFPWGESWASDHANWGERDVLDTPVLGKLDGYEWTAPPGVFPEGRSPAGASDMAGNVAEWVGGTEPAQARGGSWTSSPFDLRTTGRLFLEPGDRRTDVGFRCAYPPK